MKSDSLPFPMDQVSSVARRAVERLLRKLPGWFINGVGAKTGILAADGSWKKRYASIPPEAFPFLDTQVDGVQLAVWVDDPMSDNEPCVVQTSPMDSDAICVVAKTVDEFLGFARRPWRIVLPGIQTYLLLREAPLLRRKQWRTGLAKIPTLDGMGVIGDSMVETFPREEVEKAVKDGDMARQCLKGELAAENRPRVIALLRDMISLGSGTEPWCAEVVGDGYDALGLPLLASVAREAYQISPEMAAMLAEFRQRLRSDASTCD